MIALLLSASLWANTQWCYALHEPNKHGDVYLALTNELGCTHNWYTAPLYLDNDGHWPSIWNPQYRPSITDLALWAERYPDRTWLLFNEPERIDQANTSAFDAAIHVRYWTEAIGDNGTIACCGVAIVPGWDGWRNWLGWYLGAGGPMPDVWHVHIYAATVEQFDAALAEWDAWNAAHGNLPTIISEVGYTYAIQQHARSIQREDIPAMFWFGLPIEPEPATAGNDSEWFSTYFPLTY